VEATLKLINGKKMKAGTHNEKHVRKSGNLMLSVAEKLKAGF